MLERLKIPTVLVDGFSINAVYAFAALLTVGLCYLAMRAPGIRSRVLSFLAACLVVSTSMLAGIEQLSYPKPIAISWVMAQPNHEIVMLSPPIIRLESERVEMLVDVQGTARFFWIELTSDLAESLRKALEKWAHGLNGSLRLRIEPSWKQVPPQFYVAPWPAPPPKDRQEPSEPHRFRNDA